MTNDKQKNDSLSEEYENAPPVQDTPPDWQETPSDPEPQDLGYETTQWERIPASDGEKIVFLPKNGEALREERFVILCEDSICDLVKRR